MFVSVALAAWILGYDPTRKIVCISYSSEMAAKFANDFRRVVKSDWYRRAFPHTIVADWKDTEVENPLHRRRISARHFNRRHDDRAWWRPRNLGRSDQGPGRALRCASRAGKSGSAQC